MNKTVKEKAREYFYDEHIKEIIIDNYRSQNRFRVMTTKTFIQEDDVKEAIKKLKKRLKLLTGIEKERYYDTINEIFGVWE